MHQSPCVAPGTWQTLSPSSLSPWTFVSLCLVEQKLLGAGTSSEPELSAAAALTKKIQFAFSCFLLKDQRKSWIWRPVKCLSLCPLEVFLRKIKPLNQASSRVHHSSLSSGWFPSVTGWLEWIVRGCQCMAALFATVENLGWFWRTFFSMCISTWLYSCTIFPWNDCGTC